MHNQTGRSFRNHSCPARRLRRPAASQEGHDDTLAGTGIALKLRHLRGRSGSSSLARSAGDASCEKTPPDAPPDFGSPPQPTETEELITSR